MTIPKIDIHVLRPRLITPPYYSCAKRRTDSDAETDSVFHGLGCVSFSLDLTRLPIRGLDRAPYPRARRAGGEGVPRPARAGVLPQAELRGRLDGRVHRHAETSTWSGIGTSESKGSPDTDIMDRRREAQSCNIIRKQEQRSPIGRSHPDTIRRFCLRICRERMFSTFRQP